MEGTTKITSVFDEDAQEVMTGKMYSIHSRNSSPIISESIAKELIDTFYQLKLNRYYACIEKAKLVASHLRIQHIVLGALLVESTEPGVAYGYAYNPPLELHAWVEVGENIIDFALAGTIEKGLKTKDEIGYFLVDREPIILAGKPPTWAKYTPHEIVMVENVNILDIEKAKELLKYYK
jgi:hypothetical protein